MKHTAYLLPILGLLSYLTGCQSTNGPSTDALAAHRDTTVVPGDDFFAYANGTWFKQNPIPASEQSNGIFQLVQDTVNAQIRRICETSAAETDAPAGSNKQKIGDFFYSGMDSVALNKNGIRDLKVDFDRIDRITDKSGLIRETAYIQMVSNGPLFSFWVAQDDKNSSKYQVFLHQGGLSLPDRAYYFDTDARTVNIRERFVVHVGKMFEIMGYSAENAQKAAVKLLEMETALAKVSRKREDLRDPFANYNKMTLADLQKTTPNIDWRLFLQSVDLNRVDTIIVGQPEFLQALNGLFVKYPQADWKNYLKFQLLNGLAEYMDDKTYAEDFDFYAKTLRGIQEPKPRWKRVVEKTDGSLGELIGQVYVKEYLPKGTKEKLLEIGEAIKLVFAERIRKLDWMSAATKEKALKKLDAVIMKVGYPDKWKDLSSLQVDRSSYVKNVMNANKWGFHYMTAKFGKPVDRMEWGMQPQTYNAYYNPSNNEIVIPGCNITVPGYEGKMADDAILYAIIGGSTFGHEITHGFDDQGSKFDAAGNLSNWWSSKDSIEFNRKTRMIVDQFNEYVVVDKLHINGELTQGENIADLGGVVMGYEAFKKTKQYRENQIIAGLTPNQRYFLGYALAWMVNIRPESLANQVKSDEHSTAKYRIIGPLSNIPEFYETFHVKAGNAMYRPDNKRIKIW
jgi:putative endopeptidase